MLHASYEIWGLGLALGLAGVWSFKSLLGRRRKKRGNEVSSGIREASLPGGDIEHRALMFLMARQTDSVLATLARAIDQERQKLGGVVRNPSMSEALDAMQAAGSSAEPSRPNYGEVIPMARGGMNVADIARQLRLPEAEVDMVMRLNAA
jgi:hypothetical protein